MKDNVLFLNMFALYQPQELLGQLLLDGLSTSIANIMISAAAMTTISISHQIPTVISNLMGTIAGVFNPQMTIAYAKDDKKGLLEIIESADRIMIFIISSIRILSIHPTTELITPSSRSSISSTRNPILIYRSYL